MYVSRTAQLAFNQMAKNAGSAEVVTTSDSQPATATVIQRALTDKTVLLVGGGAGIGRTLARTLRAQGAAVAWVTNSEFDSASPAESHIEVDLAQADAARKTIAGLMPSDLLVTCTRSHLASAPRASVDFADIHLGNERFLAAISRDYAKDRIRAGVGGSIVNVADPEMRCGSFPDVELEHELETKSRLLAKEFGPLGVRVNCVRPALPDELGEAGIECNGTCDLAVEAAVELVLFLLSDASSLINGASIAVHA